MLRDSKKQDLFAIIIFGAILSGINSKSLLLNWPYISPDGFDAILEGRLIGTEDLVLPILRNPGFVFISKLDALFGGFGTLFWVANTVGLTLQYMAIKKYSTKYSLTSKTQLLILATYFISYIHFFSLFILSDTIAIGILSYALSQLTTIEKFTNEKYLKSLVLIIVGSVFQPYCLIALIPMVITMSRTSLIRGFLQGLCFPLTIYLTSVVTYENVVPHIATPANFSLLDLSLNMSSFYFNTWAITFGPVLLFVFSILSLNRRKHFSSFLKHVFLNRDLIPGYFILMLIFFYQWPESRFTYIAYAIIAPILLVRSVDKISQLQQAFKVSTLHSFIFFVALISTLLLYPKDSWKPKLSDISPGKVWIAQALSQIIDGDQSSPYRDILGSVEKYCSTSDNSLEPDEYAQLLTTDPYTQTMIKVSLDFCVFK
jgi:hypothetical protein